MKSRFLGLCVPHTCLVGLAPMLGMGLLTDKCKTTWALFLAWMQKHSRAPTGHVL